MKTIETFKEDYVNQFCCSEAPRQELLDAIDAGVEFAQRWISVDEELPVRDELYLYFSKEVLAMTDTGNYYVAYYDKSYSSFINVTDDTALPEIIKWRPIELQ